ncbi:MAG: hypothetical protein ABR886_04430 [Dehalococcoidales bacterium]|jgi:hypothetical protein
MPPKKYARYVITEDIRPKTPPPAGFLKRLEDQRQAGNYTDSAHVLSLNEMIAKGALYYDAVWMVAKHGQPPTNIEIAHSHDFDEILGFFGSYNGDAHDLGGEVEIWLEDEQYILTKSALIFAPRGLSHGPISFRKIKTPILFFTSGNGTSYTRASGKED